jgi:hypothetical protein
MTKVIILIVTGVLALIVQSVYFIKDDRTDNSAKADRPLKLRWHLAGGALHCWMYYVISDSYGYHWGIVMASLTWLTFDGSMNIYALKKEFFYIGHTALIDRVQHWLADLLNKLTGKYLITGSQLSACLKVIFVITSIMILIWQISN